MWPIAAEWLLLRVQRLSVALQDDEWCSRRSLDCKNWPAATSLYRSKFHQSHCLAHSLISFLYRSNPFNR